MSLKCNSCGKVTQLYCCKNHAYCNPECQKLEWETHQLQCPRFYDIGRSKLLEDENLQGGKHKFYLFYDKKIASRAELRIVANDPGRKIVNPVLLKLLSKYGITHLPKLEILYSFRDGYQFLRKFDFHVELESSRVWKKKWEFKEAIVTTREDTGLQTALDYLQDRKSFINFQTVLFELIVSLKTHNMSLVAKKLMKEGQWDQWEYKDDLTLFARLLLENDTTLFKPFLRHPNYSLRVTSIQNYVMSIMKKLHRRGLAPQTTIPHRSIIITLPDFDDVLWPLMRSNYKKRYDDAYSISQLKDPRCITFIAKRDEYGILGYVTCRLHRIIPKKSDSYNLGDINLRFFTGKSFNPDIYTVFSIDGLHVLEEARGGRENSVATLLVFHALYFIRYCVEISRDFGDILIASNSFARSTMLILKQFGFTHTNAVRALGWLDENPDKTNLMSEVLYYIEQHRNTHGYLDKLAKERKDDTNEEAVKIINKLIEKSEAGENNMSDYEQSKVLLKYDKRDDEWDSFLALSSKNTNTIFDKEMTRIFNLVQNHAVVKRGESTTHKKEERAKFSATFSHTFMDLI